MQVGAIVKSRAHRILRRLTNYCQFQSSDNLSLLLDLPLEDNEQPLGVYENSPGSMNDVIVVTTKGLHVFSGEAWSSIYFDQLSHAEILSANEKTSVDTLRVFSKSGKEVTIPVHGGEGGFRDAWGFLHFLNHVINDFSKRT